MEGKDLYFIRYRMIWLICSLFMLDQMVWRGGNDIFGIFKSLFYKMMGCGIYIM